MHPGMAQSATARHDSSEGKNHEEISLFRSSSSTVSICNDHRRQAYQTAPAVSCEFFAAAGLLVVVIHRWAEVAMCSSGWPAANHRRAAGQPPFSQESKWQEVALISR